MKPEETSSEDDSPTPLARIKVDTLRTTFFWPLTLDRTRGGGATLDSRDFLARQNAWLSEAGSPWTNVPDGLQHLTPRPSDVGVVGSPRERGEAPSDQGPVDPSLDTQSTRAMADAYGEFVYFHDFVQRMLFGRTDGKDAEPLRLYRRADISGLEVTFGGRVQAFDVERVNLYLLAYGIAVVAIQVATKPGSGLTLDWVLRLNDGLRRSHVPYFFPSDGRLLPGGMPEAVTWIGDNGSRHPFTLRRNAKAEGSDQGGDLPAYADLASSPDRRVLPIEHWRWLLNGNDGESERIPLATAREGYRWRHFSDDRLPILSTVMVKSVQDYYKLSEGHWMRLAFVDGPGTDPWPYARAFLRRSFDAHCYDRYHYEKHLVAARKADPPLRYLMCDYAMTAVAPTEGNSFAPTLQLHMQRHYYQMFLLQVIDKAVMLGLSSRITRAVETYGKPDHETELSAALQDIERDFLNYVHRFRFTGISGQLQPSEMHAQLRKVMGLDAMFADIKAELEGAIAFLSARESEHATEAAERLNVVASLGVVIAILMGFFSMNLLSTETQMTRFLTWLLPKSGGADWNWLRHVFGFGGGLAIVSGLALVLSHGIQGQVVGARRKLRAGELFVRRALWGLLGLGGFLAVVAVMVLEFRA